MSQILRFTAFAKFTTFVKIAILAIFLFTFANCKDCTLNDECSCTFDDGSGKVDLTSLGHTDQTPAFKDVLYQAEGYYYSYNPCGGFDEGDCNNAAVCVSNQDKSEQQQIGDATKAAFKWDDEANNILVAYTSGHGVLRLSTVNLICDPGACTPTFQPKGEQGAGQFEMTMTTVCACPGMCTASGPTSCGGGGGNGQSSGLSGGSLLLIAFFSIIIIYVIAGGLFMKFKKQATGSDIIPNKGLWASIPGLIKDGNKFVIGKLTKKQMEYDKI